MSWTVLVAMALLQLLAGVVRVRAWFHVVRDSWPEARGRIRYRDVVLAQIAGMGWNAVLPARAGDAVKIAVLDQRMPERRLTLLSATLVPPAVVEGLFTGVLVTGLIATGVVTLGGIAEAVEPARLAAVAAVTAAGLAGLAVVFRRHLSHVLANVRNGLRVLSRPRVLVTHVVPWLLVARVLRLGSFALVLPAAGVPVELAPAVAIMALQGVTPSVGAAASAARIALLSAVLAGSGVTDVPAEHVARALAVAYGAISAFNLAASLTAVALLLRTARPGRIVAYLRSAGRPIGETAGGPAARAPALAPAGAMSDTDG